MKSFSYPKKYRLLTKKDYKNVLKEKKRAFGKHLFIFYRISYSSYPKLGIGVSKSFGKAYLRNKFKRCIRESFRHLHPYFFHQKLEITVSPKSSAKKASYQEIYQDLWLFFQKIERSTFLQGQ